MLISVVEQSDSFFSYLFPLWFIIGYWQDIVLYSRSLLLIHHVYSGLHLLIPNSQSISVPPTFSLGNHLSVLYVYEFFLQSHAFLLRVLLFFCMIMLNFDFWLMFPHLLSICVLCSAPFTGWISFIYWGLQVSFFVLVLSFMITQLSSLQTHLLYFFSSQYDFDLRIS